MPYMDGREACKLMRSRDVRVPIIMLTGQDGDADTILGLDSKPMIMLPNRSNSRCCWPGSAHLRSFTKEDATFDVGPYTFRPSLKLLREDDERSA